MVLLTSNNTFGICDTSIEGHDIINNIPANGAFVMYVRTGDMIYTFLTKTSSSPASTMTTTDYSTNTTTEAITTTSSSSTSSTSSTTTTSIGIIRYHYTVYEVYNNKETLIYSSKNDSSRIFTSGNDATNNAYSYLHGLTYDDTYDYLRIYVLWEKYVDGDVIEFGTEESFIYTPSKTTSTSSLTTTPKPKPITVEPTGLVNNPFTPTHTQIPYVILYTQDNNIDHYNYNKALYENIMIDDNPNYNILENCLIINDKIIPDSGRHVPPFNLWVEGKYIYVHGSDYAEIGILKDNYVFELINNDIDLDSLEIFDHSIIRPNTTISPATTLTITPVPPTDTTTSPASTITTTDHSTGTTTERVTTTSSSSTTTDHSTATTTERVTTTSSSSTTTSHSTGTTTERITTSTSTNYSTDTTTSPASTITTTNHSTDTTTERITTSTSTNHSTDTTTSPATTLTSTEIYFDYNEFPTNGFTEMPVGVKIYTDNSEKSKEINKQLLNNYIERYQHDSKVIQCKVTYVDDVIDENIAHMIYDYDSHNGDQLHLRDYYCTIIYTITSKGNIVINKNIDTTTSPATTLTSTIIL